MPRDGYERHLRGRLRELFTKFRKSHRRSHKGEKYVEEEQSFCHY